MAVFDLIWQFVPKSYYSISKKKKKKKDWLIKLVEIYFDNKFPVRNIA